MQTQRRKTAAASPGYALMLVMVFSGASLLALAAALSWNSTDATLTARHEQYTTTVSAAEAATEKVLANISNDYQTQGQGLVAANLSAYHGLVPNTTDNPFWANFQFNDAQGNTGQTYVYSDTNWTYQVLNSQFNGLSGYAANFRIISNARQLNTPYNIVSAVKQDVQVASIPVFQFAIFYAIDLEVNPGANMKVTGRVHSNAEIYTEPQTTITLDFLSYVSAAGQIHRNKKPGDPSERNSQYKITYHTNALGGVPPLTLPIGTNNTPDAVHAVLEIPPSDEPPNSNMGKQRYYNKADLVVLLSNNVVIAKSGALDNFATPIPSSDYTNFLSTNTFFNMRENKTVTSVDVDVGQLITWSATNQVLRSKLQSGGRDVRSVYIADCRSHSGTQEAGVRVKNGQTLPSLGLTVATPNPLYVQGNYNAPAAALGTANTTQTKPASLVGDAITVLSSNWQDSNSSKDISSRTAADTTVNAAFIGGIVETGNGYYSGGVENFPRFLESWSGKTITYNGSMVVMFYSKTATVPWGGAGVYAAPNRNWAFDLNFTDPNKTPPGTPELRKIIRGQWATIQPNSTS